MNKGVQLLLERMESNPDEFVPVLHGQYPPKWRKILNQIDMRVLSMGSKPKPVEDGMLVVELPFLSDEEVTTVYDKMQNIRGDLFHKQVMNILLSDAEELSFFSTQATNASGFQKIANQALNDIFKEEYAKHSISITATL